MMTVRHGCTVRQQSLRGDPISVAHIIPSMAEKYGGPPEVVRNLASHLSGYRVNVSCWTVVRDEERAEVRQLGSWVRGFPEVFPRQWRRSPQLAREFARQTRLFDVTHLHEIWDHPIYQASKVCRLSAKPYLITAHGSLEPWCLNQRKWKKLVYSRLIGQRVLRGAACLHALTTAEIDGFVKFGLKNQFTVIPNGVEPEDFAVTPEPEEAEATWGELRGRRVVLFLGRIHPKKGLADLLRAWKSVVACHQDALLVIAGPDEFGHRARLEDIIQDEALNEDVLFTGMVSGKSKFALLSRADVFVLPSHSEGFSAAVLQAMAAGLPCLLTPGCNFPEAESAGAALIVKPSSPRLAEGLRDLLFLSEGKRKLMGERGRRLVFGNYTWDISARKFLTVYRRIIGGRQVPLYPEPAGSYDSIR